MSARAGRIDGGAYRQYKAMMRRHCKPGKDRSGAHKRPDRKKGKK